MTSPGADFSDTYTMYINLHQTKRSHIAKALFKKKVSSYCGAIRFEPIWNENSRVSASPDPWYAVCKRCLKSMEKEAK